MSSLEVLVTAWKNGQTFPKVMTMVYIIAPFAILLVVGMIEYFDKIGGKRNGGKTFSIKFKGGKRKKWQL